jgi:succinoglycan biosynthesis transport protein ExoP
VAREKTAETRARLDRIEAVINANSPDKQTIATVTDTLNNPIIVKLRSQYLDLINRESLWSREYGAGHLAVVNLRRQIREILGSIHDELRRIGETYRSEHEIAKQRQAELEKAVADAKSQYQETSQALTTLRDLESSAETFRGLYRTALQRGTELVQKQSYPGAEARLIARASPPTAQSSPKTLVILCASALGGILLGFGAGALRVSLDRMFRTPAQVETALQTRCLALAPAVKRAMVRISPPNPKSRTIKRNESIIWDVVNRPLSRFAEAMRTIRLEVQLTGPKKSITVLGFTSSLPKEGKSTIAAAFALLTAQSGTRAILVDCDLRNPALSAMLAPNAENGLLEVISGRKQLEEVLWTDPTTSLVFLPAVMKKSRAAESSAILSSPSLRAFFERLRQKYDYVIVDFSPTAPIIDVQSTAGLVDSYVFVVEWGHTNIDVAELALSKATVVQENLLGVVLNKVNFKALGHYEGYRRDYYSDKHYGQYGQV